MSADGKRIKVWDLPVRVTHWSFAVLIPAMWFTAENSMMGWHTRLGVVLLGLVVFRLIWGFIGTETTRFARFVRGSGIIIAYIRGQWDERIGHNPLGGWSVIAMLLAMSIQVGMGLFAGDPYDGATGPLNGLVGVMTADTLTEWHEIFYWVVLGLAGLHLAAIGYYVVIRHKPLIGPMISGLREPDAGADGIAPVSWTRTLFALAISVGLAVWVGYGAPPFS